MNTQVQPKIAKAVAFAKTAHSGQTRLGGESQFDHCTRVADIASRFTDRYRQDDTPAELRLSDNEAIDLIIVAVLHDVIEDTNTTRTELAELFGERVAEIVVAVSHIEEEEPDEVYLSRVAEGGRLAVLVKLFDRLDNLDTLRYAPQDFREQKLMEIRAALPIWYRIDPNGAPLIEELLEEVENG